MNHFSKRWNKKGNAFLLAVAALVLAGLIFLLAVIGTQNFLLGEVNSLVQDSDYNQVAKDSINDLNSKNSFAWDNAFALLVGGLMIGLFFAGFTINRSPIILIFTFIILFVAVYGGMQVVNVYEDLVSGTQEDIDFEANFPKSHLIMSNLLVVVIMGGLLFGMGIFIGNRVEL